MALKKKSKKKAAKRKPVRKSKPKKGLKKKVIRKKTAKKKTAKKKTSRKTAKKKPKRAASKAKQRSFPSKPSMVEPGPPPGIIPPVEEPAANEEAVGVVTHYYSHLGVAIVQINKGALRTADRIHIKGHTTDITQNVDSMEFEHQHIDTASPGQSVGIKVVDHVREHDILYLVK